MESDYVATCAIDNKTHIVINRLQFHGNFEREWKFLTLDQKQLKFDQIVAQLKCCVSAPPLKANQARPTEIERPSTKEEYFSKKRFANFWKRMKPLQESTYPLTEMKVYNRNNLHFEALYKKDYSREMR